MSLLGELYIFGTGAHAVDVADVALACGWTSLVFVEKAKTEDQFLGWSVLSEKDYFDLLPSLNFFVAIGDNYKRKQVATDTTSRVAGAEPATLLHPASTFHPRQLWVRARWQCPGFIWDRSQG